MKICDLTASLFQKIDRFETLLNESMLSNWSDLWPLAVYNQYFMFI